MNIFKILLNMIFVVNTSSQMLVGNQRDEHNCILDGGYQWCETTQNCVRYWENPCPLSEGDCMSECPPPMPCPMPYMSNMENCRLKEYTDSCGCQIRCSSWDCTNINCNSDSDCHTNQFCRIISDSLTPHLTGGRRGLQHSECVNKVGINETCGGYTLPQYQNRCLDNLECINIMGPMIADAPGICKELCNNGENRDLNGNCITQHIQIPDNCLTWMDGCNTCQVRDGRAEICTLMYCFQRTTPHCLNYVKGTQNQNIIPSDCISWNNGCNLCSVHNSISESCTERYCLTNGNPFCAAYNDGRLCTSTESCVIPSIPLDHTNQLEVGDVCYRFCEDNSQESVNRRNDCPINTICKSIFNENSVSMISYDSCDNRAWTCLTIGH